MISWTKFWKRLRALFRKGKVEAEMAEEMRLHLELQAEINRKSGLSPEEASYAALRQFGNVASIQQRARDQRGWVWVERGMLDFRYAGRMLAKNPGFTAATIVSLALCIGANTAIFSMLYGLVLKPLPYPDPLRIVEVYNSFPKVGMPKLSSNLGQYLDFEEHAEAFARLGLWQRDEFTIGGDSGPTRVTGVNATCGMFEALDIKPRLGRFFTAENHVPGADRVVVLMQSFWEAHFQADPQVLGRMIRIGDADYEIIGVAPRSLEAFDTRVRFVRPLSWPPDRDKQLGRTGYSPQLFGRLKPGATIAGAQTEVAALEARFYDSAPAPVRTFYDRTGHAIKVDSVQAERAGPIRKSLYLLQGGSLFVLLIGCLNVANLLLARTNARRTELATRVALGASQGVIVRQMLVESALLGWLGGALGVALAWAALGIANRFATQLLPGTPPFAIEVPVLAVTALLATGIAFLIGILPAGLVFGESLLGLLHSQGRGASGGRSLRATSGLLIVAQVAMALVLLTSAGLLFRSFGRVLTADRGFDSSHVISASIALSSGYEKEDRTRRFQRKLESALHDVPEIVASLATSTPFQLDPLFQVSMPLEGFTLRDRARLAGGSQRDAFSGGVSPSYLQTMRIPLRAGRWFDGSDTETSRPVVVVDENFAKLSFPGANAVGQYIASGYTPPQKEAEWTEIIGVVGNVRHNGVEDKSGNPYLYRPLAQASLIGNELSVLIRTNRPVAEVLAILRNAVAAIDPALPVFAGGPLDGVIGASFDNRRGLLLLLGSFAGLALLLSAVGIYGVLAYDVSLRTREIGIRTALGASRARVAGLILRQGLIKAAVGAAVGLAGAAVVSRSMTSLLFEVRPTDPLVYATATVLLGVIAGLASWLPARRAAKVDPVIALRAE